MNQFERACAGGRPWYPTRQSGNAPAKAAASFLMLLVLMMTTGVATAGIPGAAVPAKVLSAAVTADDEAIARRATPGPVHVLPRTDVVAGAHVSPPGAQASPYGFARYNDVINHGGAVLTATQSHNIYVNAPSTTWGDPATFLTDFGASRFVRVLDQYMPAGVTGAGRYVNGVAVSMTIPTQPLQDSDIFAIVHAAAVTAGGGGLGHVYHVFLPPNLCVGGSCNSVAYCGYHSWMAYPDLGYVSYSVELYPVPGCTIPGSGPNGIIADSADRILSHELSEMITDPEPGLIDGVNSGAWYSGNSDEIADKCRFFFAIVLLNQHSYKIQKEYSNKVHGCATGP